MHYWYQSSLIPTVPITIHDKGGHVGTANLYKTLKFPT